MSTISTFWLKNPQLWIATGDKQQVADKLIYHKFYTYDCQSESVLGKVIYLDQFLRHFSRVTQIEEQVIETSRKQATELVLGLDPDTLYSAKEEELIWYLMPFKHTNSYSYLFQTINSWLKNESLINYPILNRFFKDSYKKAYTPETVKANLTLSVNQEPYDRSICEYHPPEYETFLLPATVPESPLTSSLLKFKSEKLTVSLSGGVDSMLLTALLKQLNIDMVAVHIVYGNREESREERKFIQTYCNKLGVPLYLYTVEHLKRTTSERAFYETMTRDLRFMAYKALNRPVLLGHIQEDVIENIWTNFAKGNHLDDLAKLTYESVESDVTILRPWLNSNKDLIHNMAETLKIPHLKNTTPDWSNRGKFRAHFYKATHDQYNESVDNTVLEVAKRLKQQATLIEKLLYQAISQTWSNETKTLDITNAITLTLDADGWLKIFTDLCHNNLKITKPSYKSCVEFANRVKKGLKNGDKVNLKSGLLITLLKTEDKYLLKVI